jgi:hypothetical protein
MSETESYAIHRATEPTDICGYCAISKEIKEAVWLIGTTPVTIYLCKPCYEYIKRGEN